MSWNLPRIINNLEAEINTGYVKDPATRDFSLAGYDIRNANLVKCNDVETNTVFSVNDELEKLNNFEATTTNPDVTTIIGKLNIENIDTNTIYDLTELTRIELNDNEVNIITQNLTFNGQDVLTADNLETLQNKTFYIDGSSISPDGTLFSNSIYADKFIINNGPSPAGYLLSDGTILNNSGDGVNSNIYLYNNNTTTTPIPASGQIRFNQSVNENSTQLYVSHKTRDNLDIEDPFLSSISTLSIIYIQDQDINSNYVRFNVNSPPVIFPTSYVQLDVTFLDGGGNGLTNFGGGMNIFMSIFSNDIEINTRLSNLETKTQNVEATSSKLTLNRSLELKLNDTTDFLAVRSLDGFTNYMIFEDTIMNLYTDLNINANDLENVGSIKISGFETDNFFIKTDGTIDENDYIQAVDLINLEDKTQNQTGTAFATTFSKNVQVRLPDGSGDRFTITNDASPLQSLKFQVSQDSVQINLPVIMGNENVIQNVGVPVNPKDATNKNYVDNAVINGRTALEAKTQNQSGDLTGTTFDKNTSVVLRVADGDFFTVRNDDSPFSVSKLSVSNTSVQINSVPLFMQGQRIRDIGAPVDTTDATRKSYVDGLITPLQTATQNQTGNSGGTTFQKGTDFILRSFDGDVFDIRNDDIPSSVSKFRVNNTSVRINSVPLVMQGERIQEVGAPTIANDVASISTLTAGSVPYFTSTNRLSGASKNLFVQLGDSTIQSGIDAITFGGAVGGSVQVSSGSSSENVICVKQNYTLAGAICPPYTQTTQITGDLTIGSSGFVSTRVRVSHMKFVGNLIFDNSTNQQLRTYFYNCDWNGILTFPTSAATGTNTTQIFFDSCTFSGIGGFTIPNQSLYQIFFTRCNFIGQLITNQQPVGNATRTVFTDCAYLPTLSSLGNCILNGLNTSTTVSQGNFGSIVLGGTTTSLLRGNGTTLSGTASQFVKANATLDNSAYTTIVSATFTATFGTVTNAVFTYKYVFDGTTKIVTLGIPHIRSTITGGPLALFSSTGNALPAIIRPATESVSSIRLVVVGVFETGYIILASNGLISFAKVATAWANSALAVNGSGNSSPGDYMYITYVA